MTADLFEQTVKVLLKRQPFRPFTIALDNGRRVEVDHANAFSIREGVGIFIGPGKVPHFFEHENVTTIINDLASEVG